jgi:hypothetical protein
MVTIAGGIVLAVVILAVVPFLLLAAHDWKWWRCWALGHRWRPSSERYSTGVLSWTARAKCARCGERTPFEPETRA